MGEVFQRLGRLARGLSTTIRVRGGRARSDGEKNPGTGAGIF